MKLKQIEQVEQESFGEFNEYEASIDKKDLRFALLALSENLYSDKLGSVIREYTSNAWDANIENDVIEPILIKIHYDVDNDEWCISFMDRGIGISPERIDKVFMKYFSSTKRETDNQIGGWGIGSKSGLAYQTEFYINTIHDGIYYSYIYYKTEDLPKLTLLASEETDKPSGTEIKIALKEEDYISEANKVKKAIETQLIYFDNIIVVKDNDFDFYDNDKKILEGPDFMYVENNPGYKHIHIVNGQVAYPLDIRRLKTIKIGELESAPNVALKFNIGELDVTLNREGIEYTDKTINLIEEKYLKFKSWYFDKLWEQIGTSKDNLIQFLRQYNDKLSLNFKGDNYSFELAPRNIQKWLGESDNLSVRAPSYKGISIYNVVDAVQSINRVLFKGTDNYVISSEFTNVNYNSFQISTDSSTSTLSTNTFGTNLLLSTSPSHELPSFSDVTISTSYWSSRTNTQFGYLLDDSIMFYRIKNEFDNTNYARYCSKYWKEMFRDLGHSIRTSNTIVITEKGHYLLYKRLKRLLKVNTISEAVLFYRDYVKSIKSNLINFHDVPEAYIKEKEKEEALEKFMEQAEKNHARKLSGSNKRSSDEIFNDSSVILKRNYSNIRDNCYSDIYTLTELQAKSHLHNKIYIVHPELFRLSDWKLRDISRTFGNDQILFGYFTKSDKALIDKFNNDKFVIKFVDNPGYFMRLIYNKNPKLWKLFKVVYIKYLIKSLKIYSGTNNLEYKLKYEVKSFNKLIGKYYPDLIRMKYYNRLLQSIIDCRTTFIKDMGIIAYFTENNSHFMHNIKTYIPYFEKYLGNSFKDIIISYMKQAKVFSKTFEEFRSYTTESQPIELQEYILLNHISELKKLNNEKTVNSSRNSISNKKRSLRLLRKV